MDLHLYPRKNEIIVRAISDAYGATVVARKYIGFKKDYFARTFSWQHGWMPDLWNIDRDEVIGETYLKKFKTVFVARKTQEKYLAQCGLESKAIGLPYCYVPSANVKRNLGSLLIMPTHSTLTCATKEDQGFVDQVVQYKDSFSEIFVCMHEEDIKRKRDEIWQKEGFKIISGASFSDANSLLRMKFLFESFEVMVTDSVGSHVPYAASSGTRISIISGDRSREIDSAEPFYSGKTKTYLRKLSELHYALNSPDLSPYPFLFCSPLQAEEHVSWGQAEVGYENMLSTEDLRDSFGWNFSEYFLQRMLICLKSLKSIISKKY